MYSLVKKEKSDQLSRCRSEAVARWKPRTVHNKATRKSREVNYLWHRRCLLTRRQQRCSLGQSCLHCSSPTQQRKRGALRIASRGGTPISMVRKPDPARTECQHHAKENKRHAIFERNTTLNYDFHTVFSWSATVLDAMLTPGDLWQEDMSVYIFFFILFYFISSFLHMWEIVVHLYHPYQVNVVVLYWNSYFIYFDLSFAYPPGWHNLMYHWDKNESKDQKCNKQSIFFIEFHNMFNIL